MRSFRATWLAWLLSLTAADARAQLIEAPVGAIGGLLGGHHSVDPNRDSQSFESTIDGVSCVPTTSKVAQKTVSEVNPEAIILPHALGANISGVITSAIFAAVLITLVKAAQGTL